MDVILSAAKDLSNLQSPLSNLIKEQDMSKITYKDAGVDTVEGQRAVSLMKDHVKKTFNENVLTGLGSFGSLFRLDVKEMEEPVLVAGTDGVGTKLKIAFLMDRHDTVGQDCVAMCVNDILCQGASPLFFLDYIATGHVTAEKIADIVKGIADGCVLGECALVGGETAEMPDFYSEGEYDMAGIKWIGSFFFTKCLWCSEVYRNIYLYAIRSKNICNAFCFEEIFLSKHLWRCVYIVDNQGACGVARDVGVREEAAELID